MTFFIQPGKGDGADRNCRKKQLRVKREKKECSCHGDKRGDGAYVPRHPEREGVRPGDRRPAKSDPLPNLDGDAIEAAESRKQTSRRDQCPRIGETSPW